MIEIDHISKTIQGRKILEDIQLKIEKKRVMAIIGPSGAGKTTLLRLIAGLETPDSGSIIIDGKKSSTCAKVLPPHKRKIAMIFQNLALWPHMTVRQHLSYVLKRRKLSKENLNVKIETLLESVALNDHDASYPHQLSGGEQQRLAITRALAQEPGYLLMDEPFNNLDPVLKEDLGKILADLKSKTQIGMVCVTHDIRDFERITDQVAVMQNGLILQAGNKDDVFENPVNLFVEKHLRR